MDWDKLRVFHAVAQAGSFTHAGEVLHLSQSAASRQISALELDLGVSLFHRHARGLVLTEQGELLFRTAHDVLMKLEAVQTRLKDSKEKPSGTLRVTTTVGLGSTWLAARIRRFVELYPEIQLQIRLEDNHQIIVFGEPVPHFLRDINWLRTAGRPPNDPRKPTLTVNSVVAIKEAAENGAGIAMVPDYLLDENNQLIELFPEEDVPSLDTYFAYPAELRSSARVQAFRDFLIDQAQRWRF